MEDSLTNVFAWPQSSPTHLAASPRTNNGAFHFIVSGFLNMLKFSAQ